MRDKFDDILRSKLQGQASTPPAGMWERIAGALPGAQDELGHALRTKLHSHPVAPPPGAWERIAGSLPAEGRPVAPRRRALSLATRYAAAACLLAAVAAAALLSRHDDAPAPQTASLPGPQPAAARPDTISDTLFIPPALRVDLPSRRNTAPPAEGFDPLIATADNTPAGPSDPATGPASPATGAQEQRPSGPQQSSAAQSRPESTRDYPARAFPARYNPMRRTDFGTAARRGTSLSLYAANLGPNNTTAEGGRLAGNGYQLTEVVTRGMDQTYKSSYSAPAVVEAQHRVPLTFGLSLAFDLNPRLTLEGGVAYSYLRSEYRAAGYISEYDITQELHYMGIPVAVLYRFASAGPVDFYLRGGGAVEKGVSGTRRTQLAASRATETTDIQMRGLQFSLSASAGIQFRLAPSLGLYLEPGMNYYPHQDNQPESFRTENPVTFGLRAGLRINLAQRRR